MLCYKVQERLKTLSGKEQKVKRATKAYHLGFVLFKHTKNKDRDESLGKKTFRI